MQLTLNTVDKAAVGVAVAEAAAADKQPTTDNAAS
jgi:hypothetical protein